MYESKNIDEIVAKFELRFCHSTWDLYRYLRNREFGACSIRRVQNRQKKRSNKIVVFQQGDVLHDGFSGMPQTVKKTQNSNQNHVRNWKRSIFQNPKFE